VHPGASFGDCSFEDFARAADAIAGPLDRAGEMGVGETILAAVEGTRAVTAANVNLGIVLLLTPLAAASDLGGRSDDVRARLATVLDGLTNDDARRAYRAIRLASPGGLGSSGEQDVAAEPTVTLLEAMRLAADRDGVARQYATAFADVFEVGVPALLDHLIRWDDLESAVVGTFLDLLSHRPDSLIARKRGSTIAAEASRRADAARRSGSVDPDSPGLRELDTWLRGDGHARNPGTTADLVAATLFVALARGSPALVARAETFAARAGV
jgi:triphosphoribosyl-dephospho-CoA synthase